MVAKAVIKIGRRRCRPPSMDGVVQGEAAIAVLLDEVEEDDGVGNHDAREHQDSDQTGQR
jgi:hypothetical protein